MILIGGISKNDVFCVVWAAESDSDLLNILKICQESIEINEYEAIKYIRTYYENNMLMNV